MPGSRIRGKNANEFGVAEWNLVNHLARKANGKGESSGLNDGLPASKGEIDGYLGIDLY